MSQIVSTAVEATDLDLDSQEQLSPAAVSVRQRNAAMLLAIGSTQQQAAAAVGVDRRTIVRWCDDSKFDSLVKELHGTAWSRVQNALFALLLHAIEVMNAMLAEGVAPDDKRYVEASGIVWRLTDKLYAIASATHEPHPEANRDVGTSDVITGTVVS